MKQTISVLVENQAGVLNRITGLFSRRAFNIESLAVGVTDDPTISRITIIVDSGNSVVEQVEKQLNKLVEVIKVRTLEENRYIGRELMILKVSSATRGPGPDIMNRCARSCGAKVVGHLPHVHDHGALRHAGPTGQLFRRLLRPFSILEVARTGRHRCCRRAAERSERKQEEETKLKVSATQCHYWNACWSRGSTRFSAIPAAPS